jgi:hypothetical protein
VELTVIFWFRVAKNQLCALCGSAREIWNLVVAGLPLGRVLNFGLETIKERITRIVNGLPE